MDTRYKTSELMDIIIVMEIPVDELPDKPKQLPLGRTSVEWNQRYRFFSVDDQIEFCVELGLENIAALDNISLGNFYKKLTKALERMDGAIYAATHPLMMNIKFFLDRHTPDPKGSIRVSERFVLN